VHPMYTRRYMVGIYTQVYIPPYTPWVYLTLPCYPPTMPDC